MARIETKQGNHAAGRFARPSCSGTTRWSQAPLISAVARSGRSVQRKSGSFGKAHAPIYT